MAGIEALLQRPAPDTRDPATTATTVRTLLAAGAADLPLPGRGVTAARLGALRSLARWDVVAGRLIEAHADAVAILADLDPDGAGVEPGQWWGVWAAEPPGPAVDAYPATDGSGGWQLRGRKHWCSGAGLCTHALITARSPDGGRRLFALSLDEPGVRPVPGGWESAGMAGSDTRSVDLTGAAAREVGEPSGYLQRPGFWHGAIGVAACWLGGTDAVLDSLLRAAARLDPHGLAHLGACAASVHAAQAELSTAAASVDADPLDRSGIGRLVAHPGRR